MLPAPFYDSTEKYQENMLMKADERDELLIELRTAMLGVKGTDEKGIAGDVKEVKDHLKDLNKKTTKHGKAITANRVQIAMTFSFLTVVALKVFGVF